MKKAILVIIFSVLLVTGGCGAGEQTDREIGKQVNSGTERASPATNRAGLAPRTDEMDEDTKPPTEPSSSVRVEKQPELEEKKLAEVSLPESFDQEVAFAPQAPFALWDELHEEACEEAAMIIAAKHLKGEKLDKEIMEREIIDLVEWQKKNLGKWKDTTAKETAGILKDYFNLSAELLPRPKADDIKKELVQNKLVIVPTAGRMLDNPYFSGQGPLYHMLVVRGYDPTHFITNDPGTKRGEKFLYTYTNLLGSIHDWNNGNVNDGERVVIVVH